MNATITKYILAILLFTISFSLKLVGQEKSGTLDSKRFNSTDNYVKKMVDSLGIVGLNYAILIDDEVVHQKAFGVSNVELQTAMTLDNVFPLASISKLFSSVALHQLLNSHNRSVEETVEDFLPNRTDLPQSWKKLTLKQLLSHTSGIPDQIEYQIYLAPESEQFVINALKDKPFSSKPGEETKYNATGFLLIRIIIEKLANQDFESYMQEHCFNKYELNSAQYGGFKKVMPNRVTCYQNNNDELEMFPLNYASPMYAGAGLNMNMKDLITWFKALKNGQILSKAQLKKIWSPVKLNNNAYGQFGLGWEAYRLQDNYRMTGHGGAGISSFRHYWNEDTNQNITVIILTNGAYNWKVRPNQMNLHIASMILDN